MRKALPVLLLSLAACNQQGTANHAQIIYKGDQFFGISGQQLAVMAVKQPSYTQNNAFISEPSVMAAPTQSVAVSRVDAPKSVGVSELAPLPQSLPPASVTPASQSGTITLGSAKQDVSQVVTSQVATQLASQAASKGFIWPVKGKIISGFGQKANGEHNDGINIAATLGDPVHAVSNGTVVYAGNELKGYGNMVIVRHDNGWMSAYAHADALKVKVDDRVHQGDVIATVGKTGKVESAQLHFGLRDGKQAVDPAAVLEQNFAIMR